MSATVPDEVRTALESGHLGSPCPLGQIDPQLDLYFDTDETRTRASLMNFAIFSEDPGQLLINYERLGKIAQDHACRSLLIALAPGETQDRARSWISAHCYLDDRGAKTVCSEQVLFLLEGKCSSSIANIVLANLRSDLPLVMWWQGPLTDRFEERLYSRIDRLIVDSTHWENPQADFQSLQNTLFQQRGRIVMRRDQQFLFHDLAYTRAHRHRLAVAHAFDDLVAREAIPQIQRVEISFSPPHHTTALYLGAWISRQLDATLTEHQDDTYYFRTATGDLKLTILPGTDKGDPIQSILIASPELTVCIEPASEPGYLQAVIQSEQHLSCDLLPAPCTAEEDLVSEVLMRGGSNQLLRKTFPRFLELNGIVPS